MKDVTRAVLSVFRPDVPAVLNVCDIAQRIGVAVEQVQMACDELVKTYRLTRASAGKVTGYMLYSAFQLHDRSS